MTDGDDHSTLYHAQFEALMHVHEEVAKEIAIAEMEMHDSDFKEGHVNGLKEARNRVEELIQEYA